MALQHIVSPVDGSTLASRELATPSQIEAVLQRAADSQKIWRTTPIAERAAVVERMVQVMERDALEIATELTWQMGRPVRYTPNEILRGFQERARYMSSIAASNLSDIATPQVDGFTKWIRREPLGTVLVVVP
ncbi:MAG: aldehyde dehydrogenase family protein, partial [Actinomycetota bacterium]